MTLRFGLRPQRDVMEAPASEKRVLVSLRPGKVVTGWAAHAGNRHVAHFVTVHNNTVVGGGNSFVKTTLSTVVLQKVGQNRRTCQVVDGNNLNTFHVIDLAENQAADAAKAIDGNFYRTHCWLVFVF